MQACNCQMMTRDELQALVRSERSADRDQAVNYLVSLLTSADPATRRQGYELFKEGLAETLFCSCLDYGSLAGGFTEPLIDIVTRTIEFWAASREPEQAAAGARATVPRP